MPKSIQFPVLEEQNDDFGYPSESWKFQVHHLSLWCYIDDAYDGHYTIVTIL